MHQADPSAAGGQAWQPDILDPALQPRSQRVVDAAPGVTAAGVEQPEAWAVVGEGSQRAWLDQAVGQHELLQQRELLHHHRDEDLAFHAGAAHVVRARHVKALQQWRPVVIETLIREMHV